MENISHSIERWTFKCDTNRDERNKQIQNECMNSSEHGIALNWNEHYMVVQNHWFDNKTTAPNVRTFSANAYLICVKCLNKTTRPNKFSTEQTCRTKKIQSISFLIMHSTMAIMFFIIKTCYWVRFSIINDFLDISDPTMMPPHSRSQPTWQPILTHLMDVQCVFGHANH